MTNFTVGAQMFSVRNFTQDIEGLRDTLKKIKEIGYNTCQISGIGAKIRPEEVREALDEASISCDATHMGFERFENELDEIIRIHKLWKCAYPGVGGLPQEYRSSAEGFVAFAKKAEKIAEKLADHGMHFLYHNHAFELQKFDGVTALEILMDNAPKYLMFEIDTYWIQAGGADPVEWIYKVKGRMDVVHFKDMSGVNAYPMTTMVPVGEGNLNWPKILRAADDIGVKFAFVEQDNAVETDSIACMKTSRDNLVRYGARF